VSWHQRLEKGVTVIDDKVYIIIGAFGTIAPGHKGRDAMGD